MTPISLTYRFKVGKKRLACGGSLSSKELAGLLGVCPSELKVSIGQYNLTANSGIDWSHASVRSCPGKERVT